MRWDAGAPIGAGAAMTIPDLRRRKPMSTPGVARMRVLPFIEMASAATYVTLTGPAQLTSTLIAGSSRSAKR